MATGEGDEKWMPVPGFPGYEASTLGRIRNGRGQVLTGTITRKGYRQVSLRGSRGRVSAAAHRLIAATFLRPPGPDFLVAHINGNKLDNRPSNLELTTPAAFIRRAAALGQSWPAHARGESNPNAKLSEDDVRRMRALRQQGMSYAELGRRFGVTERAAHRVVKGDDWKHVA